MTDKKKKMTDSEKAKKVLDAMSSALGEILFDVGYLESSMRGLFEQRRKELIGETEDLSPMMHCHGVNGKGIDNLPLPINLAATSKERRTLAATAGKCLGEAELDLNYMMMETMGWHRVVSGKEYEKLQDLADSDATKRGATEVMLVTGTTMDGRQLSLSAPIHRIGSDSIDVQGPVTSVDEPELMKETHDHIMEACRRAYIKARCVAGGIDLNPDGRNETEGESE